MLLIWQRDSALKIMSLVIHLLAFFSYIIYLNYTQLVLFLSHENNLIFFFLLLMLGFFVMLQKFQTYIQYFFSLKSPSPFKKYCTIFLIESPLEVMKNVFYLVLQAFHVLKILKFLSQHFGLVGKTALLER